MKTKVVNIKLEEGKEDDIYIGRPSIFGNPYSHIKYNTKAEFIVETREEAIECYRNYILNGEGKHLLKHLYKLKGKRLSCFCKPLGCHGDVLAELADVLPEALTVDKILNLNKK